MCKKASVAHISSVRFRAERDHNGYRFFDWCLFFEGRVSICARAWQDCAVLKEVCRTDSGSTPDKPQFNKERCTMTTKEKQPGLLYVREDDEYTYYASSMNIY